jgi:AcrR family transcriptional regulator
MPKKARKSAGAKDPIEAALALAAERNWRDVTLDAIAERAGMPLAALFEIFPSKAALLAAFSRRIDAQIMAARDEALADRPAHERLFDVVMRRFDALAPHKEALRSVLRGSCFDAEAGLAGACALNRAMAAMLEAAGLSSSGVRGALRRKGLAIVYLDTMRVWLSDDSPDMARTMKALDGHLRRIDRLIRMVRGEGGSGPRDASAPA